MNQRKVIKAPGVCFWARGTIGGRRRVQDLYKGHLRALRRFADGGSTAISVGGPPFDCCDRL